MEAFTTLFSYDGRTYEAVLKRKGDVVQVFFPDERLHPIFPNGKATFHLRKGIRITPPSLSPEQDVLLSILCLVEEKPGY